MRRLYIHTRDIGAYASISSQKHECIGYSPAVLTVRLLNSRDRDLVLGACHRKGSHTLTTCRSPLYSISLNPDVGSMYNEILVPLDGSDCSVKAANHSFELAQTHNAVVHLLHVVDLSSYRTYFDLDGEVISRGRVTQELRRQGEGLLQQAASLADDTDIEVVEAVKFGRPYKEILGYASEHNIDIIVMGTTGKSGVKEWFLGSVSRRVAQGAPIPVTLVSSHDVENQ